MSTINFQLIHLEYKKFLKRHKRFFNKKKTDKFNKLFVNWYRVEYPLVQHSSNNRFPYFYIPFYAVIRGTQKDIEIECEKNWPQFMEARALSMDELKEFRKMQKYIKTNLTITDEVSLLYSFYDNLWFLPFRKVYKNFVSVTFNDYNCKWWQKKEPYLEVKGYFTFNILQYIHEIIKAGFVKMYIKKDIGKRIFKILFEKPMAPILLTMNTTDFRKKTLEYILADMNNVDDKSGFIKFFKKLLYLKQYAQMKDVLLFQSLDKEIGWDGKSLVVTFKNIFRSSFERKYKKLKDKSKIMNFFFGVPFSVLNFNRIRKEKKFVNKVEHDSGLLRTFGEEKVYNEIQTEDETKNIHK